MTIEMKTKARNAGPQWRRFFTTQEFGVFVILALMCLFLSLTTDTFFTSTNIFNVLRAFSWIAIAAFGEIVVIIIAGIDLSVGSTMALAGLAAGFAFGADQPMGVGLVAGILTGAVVGLVNGLIVTKGKLPAFIATLGTLSIGRGLCYGLTNGQPLTEFPASFRFLGQYDVPFLGVKIPLPAIYMVVLAIIMGFFLARTIWGYRIYALGGNEQATALSGINIERLKLLVFTLSGLLAGIGGVIMTARLGVAAPTAASGYELDVIAAVFIGGASTSGGEGSIVGALMGAAIMQVLRNGLVLLGFPAYWQPAAIGLVIVITLMLDQYRKRRGR
jgi:ribose transport system permease protein